MIPAVDELSKGCLGPFCPPAALSCFGSTREAELSAAGIHTNPFGCMECCVSRQKESKIRLLHVSRGSEKQMDVALRRPNCGATGESGMKQRGQDSAFEIRGQWNGKPVQMCNSCMSGLMVGVLGVRAIGPELRARMQESWKGSFG